MKSRSALLVSVAFAVSTFGADPRAAGDVQIEADEIVEGVYKANGIANTFLIVTNEGNVVIDTSLAENAPAHKKLLGAVSDEAPKYIVITHAHGDHVGGLAEWKADDTEVIMQENAVEFLHYQERLRGFFARRNVAQFGYDLSDEVSTDPSPGNFDAKIPATILFDEKFSFRLGGLTFEIFATPGETYDALSVWIPEKKILFSGDLFYRAFPTIYTPRGTKPRWALDYVRSLDKVISFEPEILIPSHQEPLRGKEEVRRTLVQYRDAILFVHDAVVAGMNAGKSREQLVAEIVVPLSLSIPETYGMVSWSVRGIYDGYAGWFDGDPSTLLGVSAAQSRDVLVEMAGGADEVAERAAALLDKGDIRSALSLADVALAVEPENKRALRVRKAVFEAYAKDANNLIAQGWLASGIRDANSRLGEESRAKP